MTYKPKLYRLLYLPAGDYIRVPYFTWDSSNGCADEPYMLENFRIKSILTSIVSCYEQPEMFTSGITQKVITHNNLLTPILTEHFVIEEVI